MNGTSKTIVVIFAAALLAGAAYFYYSPNAEAPVTNEETGANNNNLDWRTASSSSYSFQYPASLGTTYVQALDWPPQVAVWDEAYSCLEAGDETARAGRTEAIRVGTHQYCRTMISEGAAGSIYIQYAYAFAHEDKTVIFSFSTRAPQCPNYDEPQKSACEEERAALDIDSLIDRIAETFTMR